MLLDDDVMADREPKPGALACGLGGEERIEHLFPNLRWDANTIVAYPDLHAVAETFSHSRNGRLETATAFLPLALGRCVEAILDQVQEYPGDFLGKNIDLTGRGVKGVLQLHIEALGLGTCSVIGKIEAFLDE